MYSNFSEELELIQVEGKKLIVEYEQHMKELGIDFKQYQNGSKEK